MIRAGCRCPRGPAAGKRQVAAVWQAGLASEEQATDVLRLRPDGFDPDLPEINFAALAGSA